MQSNAIFPHQHSVTQEVRSLIKGHQPLLIWLTGLSGSGKSTLANALEARLVSEFHAHTYLLDGDNIRTGLNAGLGFSEADRRENIRRIGEVARLMLDAGLLVITAFISPYREDRDAVRQRLAEGVFWEVYVDCPLDICMQRDPKGLYRRAINGEIASFTGISAPYEEPLNPELVVNSAEEDVGTCVDRIIQKMIAHGIINKNKE